MIVPICTEITTCLSNICRLPHFKLLIIGISTSLINAANIQAKRTKDSLLIERHSWGHYNYDTTVYEQCSLIHDVVKRYQHCFLIPIMWLSRAYYTTRAAHVTAI